MATNVLIAKKQAADTAATLSIPEGGELTLAASGLTGGEKISIEQDDGEGGHGPMRYIDENGKAVTAQLTRDRTIIKIQGAFEGRINKPLTEGDVGVVSYT